ncbi:MAG: CPBP family intramembrane metalloprotease [Planctomycetes bacterium]|nr:CPBP family intramembrane metalloprotease [Planctomycetota bacterium]
MSDGPDPPPTELPIRPESTNGAIPIARPVIVADAAATRPRQHAILLLDAPRKAAFVDIGLLIFLVMAFEIVAQVLAWALLAIAAGGTPQALGLDEAAFGRMLTMPILAFRAVGVTLVVGVILRNRKQTALSVGVDGSGWVANCLLGVATTGLAYGLIVVWQMGVWFLWPELVDQMNENAYRLIELIPKRHPLILGCVAMVVALYEELFFRGFLMTRLRRLTHSWTLAILISTAVFTAAHAFDQTLAALGPIAILSLVFSVVTVWRRSLIPAVVGHFLFDWSQFLALYFRFGDQWT